MLSSRFLLLPVCKCTQWFLQIVNFQHSCDPKSYMTAARSQYMWAQTCGWESRTGTIRTGSKLSSQSATYTSEVNQRRHVYQCVVFWQFRVAKTATSNSSALLENLEQERSRWRGAVGPKCGFITLRKTTSWLKCLYNDNVKQGWKHQKYAQTLSSALFRQRRLSSTPP